MAALHRVVVKARRTVFRHARSDLLLRARGIHAARSEVGVAADVRHLFEHDDRGAGFLRHNRRRKAGAARSDDHDVKAFGKSARTDGAKRCCDELLSNVHSLLLLLFPDF